MSSAAKKSIWLESTRASCQKLSAYVSLSALSKIILTQLFSHILFKQSIALPQKFPYCIILLENGISCSRSFSKSCFFSAWDSVSAAARQVICQRGRFESRACSCAVCDTRAWFWPFWPVGGQPAASTHQRLKNGYHQPQWEARISRWRLAPRYWLSPDQVLARATKNISVIIRYRPFHYKTGLYP